MGRKAWIVWTDGTESPLEEGSNGVISLPLIGPDIAAIRLAPPPGAPPPQGVHKSRLQEMYPLGTHSEHGAPPRILHPVADNRPDEVAPAKPKRRKAG